jgi:hypothetical protein
MSNYQPDDLLKEKNLLDIYSASRGKLSLNRFNNYSTLFVGGLLVAYVSTTSEDSSTIAAKLQHLAELGFSFSAGILGFLIAGFTIFATVSDKELFIQMAKHSHDKSGLNYLKFNFFTLMNVFILYTGFAVACLLVILFGGTSGFIATILKFLSSDVFYPLAKRIATGVGFAGLGTSLFYLLMLLQSFIFNIYHIVMTGIAWEIQKLEDNEQD